MNATPCTLAQHINRRLAALGARRVFSVPGNKGIAARTMDELRTALQSAAIAEGPLLIAVKLDPRRLPAEIAQTLQPTAAALAAGDRAAVARIAPAAFD